MTYLNILRRLAYYQQFDELRDGAESYLAESGDISVLPLLAFAYASLGQRDQVESLLVRIDEQMEHLDSGARVDLAAVYILTMRVDDARALLESVLQDDAKHALALARLAWCCAHDNQLQQAQKLYEQSEAIEPGRLQLYTNLIQLCLEQDDHEAAQLWLDKAIVSFEHVYDDLPEHVAELQTTHLRCLQLEIWVADEAFARVEEWLEEKRESIEEDEWCGLLTSYAAQLGKHDRQDQGSEALRKGLKYYPEKIELHEQLAELEQVQGHFMQGMHLLRRAIKLAEEQEKMTAGLWARLSSVCLHRSDEQARFAAEKAVGIAEALEVDEQHPEAMLKNLRLQAKNALAQVESQEQNFEEADKLFRELLDDNAWFLPALQGLGQQQMQRGKIDEAVELFERVKEIAPAKGYSALINARQFPDDEETLNKIEKAARQPSMEGAVSAGLLFQLASAWEKQKDYDKAFGMAQEANDASRRFLKYDGKEHRNSCARTRAAFCPELYEHRKERGSDSTLPVFVLGMPRSGTTLIEQILAGHSEIFGAGELGVIPQVVQGLERWERHVGSGRQYPDCVDDLNPYVSAGIAENVLKELQEFDESAKHVVDKLPHNFENVGLIKFLFPNAKIISVRRDPRDIAISNYFTDYQAKHGGMGFAYDLTSIGEQLADHNLLMHHWHELFPGEILEINYEDVVDDTEGSARKMLDYIGVEWEPQVLAFNELDRPVKTASVWQVRQPIYKTSKAKWMRYEKHLEPLIAGTNAKIEPDPITDMARLPVPGLLVDGVALYEEGKLDEAEYKFKQLMHHVPEHAAANFMVGSIYVQKHHLQEGIALMEKGHEQCPWNKNWSNDLIQAYELNGETGKAETLRQKGVKKTGAGKNDALELVDDENIH